MSLDLSSCTFLGPALPEPFVKFDLEGELLKTKLLPSTMGEQGKELRDNWNAYRRGLREMVSRGGPLRVRNQVIAPLLPFLGYREIGSSGTIQTREGQETGGFLLLGSNGASPLRVWTTDFETDLDAPARRGYAYRYSHLRIAQRVLLTMGERVGLLTNGVELRILISDPARPDSQIIISIDPDWKRSRDVPDSFRLLFALCSPQGIRTVPSLVDKARLKQTQVTKELRVQARQAIEGFIQGVLNNPSNREKLGNYSDRMKLAKELWREGLIIVYRLLFILKGEASDDPARSFGFASTSLWRNTYSPSVALAPYARKVLDEGAATGGFLEQGLRTLFRLFEQGIECTELHVVPLGGALFGTDTTPLLSGLEWGEQGAAYLIDRLLWTPRKRGSQARERVHYGPLDVEDLGRVYEALLELEPGISTEPMCRLRRQKLEVVVPIAQGEKYRPKLGQPAGMDKQEDVEAVEEEETEDKEERDTTRKKTKVEWVEAIEPGQFYLRVGLGRKTSGSFYTPHSFVRFLVQETLEPQVVDRSPKDDPNPGEMLRLKVLDPAMGSGHFLVEACRFLGDKLYEACRACDEKALEAERRAEAAAAKNDEAAFTTADKEANKWRQRIADLPDPEDELLRYLPSRAPEGEESGLSQKKAQALCRRLVAVHCLYGVDKNPLAVELAKLSLWLESQAEGLPLTFLDHRLVVGDSLTGPFWDKLILRPGDQQPIQDLFHQNLDKKFMGTLREAIKYVNLIDESVGITLSDLENKRYLKSQLDKSLAPFKVIAAAWSGGVMLGKGKCDDVAYGQLVRIVGETGDLPEELGGSDRLPNMIAKGLGVDVIPKSRDELYRFMMSGQCSLALPYDLTFPEVFFPNAEPFGGSGFHATLGNPPWKRTNIESKEFFAAYDLRILEARTRRERVLIERELLSRPLIADEWRFQTAIAEQEQAILERLFPAESMTGVAFKPTQDLYRYFSLRALQTLNRSGFLGMVLPGGLHSADSTVDLRKLFLNKMLIKHFYCFRNQNLLFETGRTEKFTLIVAIKSDAGTLKFPAAFELTDDQWLFEEDQSPPRLEYSIDIISSLGGRELAFPEVKSSSDIPVVQQFCIRSTDTSHAMRELGISLSREFHMTDDSPLFEETRAHLTSGEDPRHPEIMRKLNSQGIYLLHEGKTLFQFDTAWEQPPAYVVQYLKAKHRYFEHARYFRIASRCIVGFTEQKVIMALIPPGCVTGNSLLAETNPGSRPNSHALAFIAVSNTFSFDWLAHLRVDKNLNLFILTALPFPREFKIDFLARSALRLVSINANYLALWHEQLNNTWRENQKEPFSWPVLSTEEERWEIRSAIDVVVADTYGLSRDQYEHVLHSFDRASGPNLYTTICLEKFDELKAVGLDSFTKKYDPYWDIPLVETLPKPVIDFPDLTEIENSEGQAPMNLEEV